MKSTYDNKFYDYINIGSASSARVILPKLLSQLDVKSVLDVGCGQGAWLSIWQELGVSDIIGIDGEYVNREKLLIGKEQFVGYDLSKSIKLDRKFDLVQSLEVAEHIPEQYSKEFVSNLVRHGDIILFSAAAKGQGGDEHINEQDYEFWRAIFAEFDYSPIDCVRSEVSGNSDVEPWYRYNSFIYVSHSVIDNLPENYRSLLQKKGTVLPDVSTTWYRLRKLLIRCLPVWLKTKIAKIKESLVISLRR